MVMLVKPSRARRPKRHALSRDDPPSHSWNSSHPSRGPDGGCSQADLRSTGGDGLFYCFAAQ
jgi:hypothetical protein